MWLIVVYCHTRIVYMKQPGVWLFIDIIFRLCFLIIERKGKKFFFLGGFILFRLFKVGNIMGATNETPEYQIPSPSKTQDILVSY